MLKFYVDLTNRLVTFSKEERGAVAIEYALLALLIAVALVASMSSLRGAIAGAYGKVEAQL